MAFFHFISRPSDPAGTAPDAYASRVPRQSEGGWGGARIGASELSAAQQFEALLIQQILKQVRQAGLHEGLLESDQTRLVQSVADEQLAQQLAQPGLGLAQALLDQIRGVGSAGLGHRDGPLVNAVPSAGSTLSIAQAGTGLQNLTSVPGSADRRPAEHGKPGPERHSAAWATNRSARLPLAASSAFFAQPLVSAELNAVQGAPRHISHFVDRMGDAARRAAYASGVPAELILGQAALETGWGRREIKGADGQPSYNVFGIKASSGWKGKVVEVLTTEYTDDRPRKVVQTFRAYGSYQEAFTDYARLISKNARYKHVVGADSPSEAARQIQKAGYATDPSYASKLISIMAYFQPRAAR